MNEPLLEEFLSSASMVKAEQALLAQGERAIPILESLFNGQAKDRSGVPYRQLGLPLHCALEVARRLGPVAKPLEPYLREELKSGNYVAAMALGSLGSIDEASITELVAGLSGDINLSYESAAALVRCGQGRHPAVVAAASTSKRIAKVLEKVEAFVHTKNR